MTIANMHIAVKLGLDKSAKLELPAFEPEEIDLWLNDAIRKFVKTRYSGTNAKGKSFEETQKRIDDLRSIVVFDTLTSSSSTEYTNAYTVDLPADYWFSVSEEVAIVVSGVSTNPRIGVTQVSLDEYTQKLADPFSEHILHYSTAKPLRFIKEDTIVLTSDGNYTIPTVYLTYLKKPAEVQVTATAVDCDLPEHTHDEIVKLAVNMMLENIEQPRYRTHLNEVNSME